MDGKTNNTNNGASSAQSKRADDKSRSPAKGKREKAKDQELAEGYASCEDQNPAIAQQSDVRPAAHVHAPVHANVHAPARCASGV